VIVPGHKNLALIGDGRVTLTYVVDYTLQKPGGLLEPGAVDGTHASKGQSANLLPITQPRNSYDVRFLSVYNGGAFRSAVTVVRVSAGGVRVQFRTVLPPGTQLLYTPGTGFCVLDADGRICRDGEAAEFFGAVGGSNHMSTTSTYSSIGPAVAPASFMGVYDGQQLQAVVGIRSTTDVAALGVGEWAAMFICKAQPGWVHKKESGTSRPGPVLQPMGYVDLTADPAFGGVGAQIIRASIPLDGIGLQPYDRLWGMFACNRAATLTVRLSGSSNQQIFYGETVFVNTVSATPDGMLHRSFSTAMLTDRIELKGVLL
jgi:hypothetical protein